MRQVVAEQQQRLQVAQHAGETEEQARAARAVRKSTPKLGRNDRCPCGSGKKYKDCHLGREGELFALLKARETGAPQQAAPSVSAQLATGGAGTARPPQAAPRGRAAPPSNTAKANGKPGKTQPQAQRGKGAQAKKKS